MGSTKASKLLARKRPALRPIGDSVIAKTTGAKDNLWEPLRSPSGPMTNNVCNNTADLALPGMTRRASASQA